MIYHMYFFLIVINFIFGIKKILYPLNKFLKNKNMFIAIVSFFCCYIFISGYRNFSGLSDDVTNNAIEFERVINGSKSMYEAVYVGLIKFGSYFTHDYYVWRNIVVFIFLSIFFIVIYKFVDNVHFVYAMFSAYLVILSSVQLRNFLALVVFLIGLLYFVNSNHTGKRLVFIVFTLLAGLIHSSFFIYFFLLLADKTFSQKTIKKIGIGVILFCVLIFINGNNIPGMRILLNFVNESRVLIYLTQKTRLGFLYPMIMHLSSVFITYYIMKKTSGDNEKYKLIFKINALMMICFPLYMLQTSFYRIARNLLILTYISEGDSILRNEIKIQEKMYIILYSIVSLLIWIIIDLYITTPKEVLLIPFFEDNIFLQIK
ncbi:MAG: hypothetical protein PWR27_1654 [Petroclostridium sp.]|nr:hypothetical protein [Petroclostridium sp.]